MQILLQLLILDAYYISYYTKRFANWIWLWGDRGGPGGLVMKGSPWPSQAIQPWGHQHDVHVQQTSWRKRAACQPKQELLERIYCEVEEHLWNLRAVFFLGRCCQQHLREPLGQVV